MNYLAGEDKPSNAQQASKKSAKSNALRNTDDEKLLRSIEQDLKRVNNIVEDLLEKVRVKRGL